MDLRTFVPEWVRTLQAYPPGKPIEELERELGVHDSIKLASNENPLGPSPRALAAITAALPTLHRYPDGSAFYLTRRLAERHGVSPEQVMVGNGSNELIELVVRTFLRPGDEAVMADQAFVIYRLVTQAVGGIPRIVPLRDFTHDLDAIADAVTPRTRLVFLANPNNPTGTIYHRAAWRGLLDTLRGRQLLIVADDAYAEFVADPDYPDSITERNDAQVPVVSLRTFSKLFGLAGLRIGFAVGPAAVIEVMSRIRQPFNVNLLAQVAALAALDDREHVDATLRVNREGMATLCEGFERLGLEWIPSHANFVMVRVGGAPRIYEALLRRGVIVRPMEIYGFPEHLRVTVGLAAENARFLDALAAVLAEAMTRVADRVLVAGVGLIGGSFALAARAAGLVGDVVGFGRTRENLEVARARGIVDRIATDPADAMSGVDLVLLTAPVGTCGALAAAFRPYARAGIVLTDAGSVKQSVIAAMEQAWGDTGAVVGAHPIAGSEASGAAAARADLFRGRRCIVTPGPRTTAEGLRRVRALWEGVGAVVEEMSAPDHDAILARVSHVPHLLAYALVTSAAVQVGGRDVLAYAGSGFRDTTRIAGSRAELWRDIALENAAALGVGLDAFRAALDALTDAVRQGDAATLDRLLGAAERQRRALGDGS